MRIRPLLVVLAIVLGVFTWSAATCFPRQCDGPENCLKSCRCEDQSRGEIVDCPLFFMCNTESGVCEDGYNMSCDEFCGTFAARGACGSKRCDDEGDCDRRTVCQAEDANSDQTIPFDCQIRFTCDADRGGVCGLGYEMDDPTFCATFGAQCLSQLSTP